MNNDNSKYEIGSLKKSDDNSLRTSSNFIREIIEDDLKANKNVGRIQTRFPPEPNGYLHIGHAKSICLNFGIAKDYNGFCNLRFDDTNPCKEEVEYIESIKEDIKWLGFDWEDRMFYASDYFDELYQYAVKLINRQKAYICDLTAQEIREFRGSLTTSGKNSPFRNRSIDENLILFERMKNGEFEDGSKVLRAKIDMSSPNLNMRDPVIYRILHSEHHRTGNKWFIYPMYDFAHGQSDSIEKITHSICTLEFEDHRPLYDWFLDELGLFHPQQIEFARLNLSYTVLSKRKLLELVEGSFVNGWDDPRMPTISGFRRRGYTPESIRIFCDRIGVAKRDNIIDVSLLEFSIREDLNRHASRFMAVLKPIKLTIVNYPEDKVEYLEAVNNPEDPNAGKRMIPFSKYLYIEQDDFKEVPPKKYFRLSPGVEVRLRYAYIIKCIDVIKDNTTGEIKEVLGEYISDSISPDYKNPTKVKGTIHWLSSKHAIKSVIRLYDRLFLKEDPNDVEDGFDYKKNLNPNSLEELTNSYIEPGLADAVVGKNYQFERQGYFCLDSKDSSKDNLVFNRTVTLKDAWAKIEMKGSGH